ncbi:MAG: PilZ domain-containing protein [Acidobacteriota bacterium]
MERRKGSDRRAVERFIVSIDIEWEGLSGKQIGTISDLSVSGCFVLCSGEVEDGDYVKISFPLSTGKKFEFQGEVTNHVFEIGFGLCFINLSETQKEFLEVYIDTLRED